MISTFFGRHDMYPKFEHFPEFFKTGKFQMLPHSMVESHQLERRTRPAFLTLISFCIRNFDKVKTAMRFPDYSTDLQLTLIWYLWEMLIFGF